MIAVPGYVSGILETLRAAGFEAYPVGGCVRDSLMGREPQDWDVCTSALPEETAALFAGHRVIGTGMKHGTVTVMAEGRGVEITTFRTESGYTDGRHPDRVAFVGSIEEDLSRRDFTINAMALGADGEIIDPFGGRDDLQAGRIRCVGDPARRFGEDALRILRALRFSARLGFPVEEGTARAAEEGRALLQKISPERIFSELKGILTGAYAGTVLRRFPDIVFEIIPELRASHGFEQHNRYHIHDVWTHTTMAVDAAGPDPVLRLTMLLHDIAKPATFHIGEDGFGHFYGHGEAGARMADGILRRLRCDNAAREEIVWLIGHHDTEPPRTKKTVRRMLIRAGEPRFRRLIACWRADIADRAEAIRAEDGAFFDETERLLGEILAEESCFSLRDLAVSGDDLIAAGMAPGPELGRVLRELFRLVTEEGLPNEREALLEKMNKLQTTKKTD